MLVPLRRFGQSMQPFALSFTAIPWDPKYGIRWGLASVAIPSQLLALQARQTMMPLLDIPAAVNVIAVLKLPFAKKTGFRMLHYTSSLRAGSRPTPVPAVPPALDVKIEIAL